MSRLPRRWLIVCSVVAAVLVVSLPGVGYAAYDGGVFATFPPGVRIAGVDVAGMSRSEAAAAVRSAVEDRLDRQATVRVGDRSYTTTLRELGARAHVSQAVDQAVRKASEIGWWQRLFHTADTRTVNVEVSEPDPEKVDALVHRMVTDAYVPARDASVRLEGGRPVVTDEKEGRRIDPKEARAALRSALAQGGTRTVELDITEPDVTSEAFGTVLVIDTSAHSLSLYKSEELASTYPVATGMPAHPTPHGEFRVTLKRPHPTWVNPAPNGWGADMPESIPPGPGNPLGLRALNISSPGIRIHGTSAASSIGNSVSHGCIRLHNSDILELYPRVPEGATVFIVA